MVWKTTVPTTSPKNPYNTWGVGKHGFASSSVAIDKTGIYVFYGATGALAFDHAGKELWRTDCGKGVHVFGAGTSPVLHKDMVIINAMRNKLILRVFAVVRKQVMYEKNLNLCASQRIDMTETFHDIIEDGDDARKCLW